MSKPLWQLCQSVSAIEAALRIGEIGWSFLLKAKE